MPDVPYKPEEQALKRIEEQQRAEIQRELERKVGEAKPASGDVAFKPEPASENEKLKLAVSDQRFARNVEAEYDLKQHLQRAERPLDKRDLSREEHRQLIERDLSTKEKGEIGERAMMTEEKRQGREMLLHHADNPNKPGLDGVSWDPKERRLYVIEAKNYQEGSTVSAENLSALSEPQKVIDEARDAVRNSDLSTGDKIAAQSALRNRKFTAELYVPDGVKASESARQLLTKIGGDAITRRYDGRILWSQERRVVGRQL
jgi:hypothetical protein